MPNLYNLFTWNMKTRKSIGKLSVKKNINSMSLVKFRSRKLHCYAAQQHSTAAVQWSGSPEKVEASLPVFLPSWPLQPPNIILTPNRSISHLFAAFSNLGDCAECWNCFFQMTGGQEYLLIQHSRFTCENCTKKTDFHITHWSVAQ